MQVFCGFRDRRAPHNPEGRAATARRANRRGSGRSARPDEGVIGLALEEVGVDRRREGRIVELDRVILCVLLRGAVPRGPYLDVAHQHPQVRGLDVDESVLMVPANTPSSPRVKVPIWAMIISVCCFKPATIAALMAIRSPGTADPQP